MKNLILTVLLIALVVLSGGAKARDYTGDVSSWIIASAPAPDSEAFPSFFERAWKSGTCWTIRVEGDKVTASTKKSEPPTPDEKPDFKATVEVGIVVRGVGGEAQMLNRSKAEPFLTHRVDDGWIIAYNRGEFGGAVYWFSADGKERRKLSNHSINEMVTESDRIVAAEGLSHRMTSHGSLIEIVKGANGWQVNELLRLPQSADLISRIARGEYLVVTSGFPAGKLLKIRLKREITTLIPEFVWGNYASSLVLANNFIYVGSYGFVARCPLADSNQAYDLMIPDESWLPREAK